ncbi:MAG TPA: TorF family putative porin [Gammaproteobacteria bacterium]|nr:TorF family putative porin [Gammaproteobacteria bacterium]
MLFAGATLVGAGARADDAVAPVSLFSGDVQFRTNYVARGISQSQGQPSVQGEIDINSGDGVYGGVNGNSINWIDQLHPGDNVSLDADGWLGYRKHFGSDWTTKVGLLRIQFPGHYVPQSPPADQPNSTEAFGYVAWKGLSAQLNYAVTNYVGIPDSKGTTYLSLSASQPVGGSCMLGAHLGREAVAGHSPVTGQSNSIFNYTDYKLFVAYDLGSGISLTLARTWTNANLNIYTINGYALGGHHTSLLLEKDF